ncbi:hypothetical protein [Lysobacter panacisoli]|uniref:Lipoprotein n=1 Tax=Lysobacter panacisoli TaxID=1255263 RepID=A0ABP9LTQ0_9GAMM|nr:hypothetical protein [Lysobacter panacisoli]
MKKLCFVLWVLASVAGCATDATWRATRDELPGAYYSGDGLGRNVYVVLRADGSYTSEWDGCLGVYGTGSGTWHLNGDQVVFESRAADGHLAQYLTHATTIRHDGVIGFARHEDVKRERVDEGLVFLRQTKE